VDECWESRFVVSDLKGKEAGWRPVSTGFEMGLVW